MATILTRTHGAENLNAEFARLDTESGVSNDFDSREPWKNITVITDDNGDKWVRIPKFYTEYLFDDSGNIKDRSISVFKAGDTYHLNPLFSDGEHELPYVDIGAYLLSVDDGGVPHTKSGDTPIKGSGVSYHNIDALRLSAENRTTSEFRYQLFDVWAWMMLCDLFTVEYATIYVANVMHGYRNFRNQGAVFLIDNGSTDALTYHSGIPTNAIVDDDGRTGIKYRNIEHPWGCGLTFIDGIRFNGTDIYVSNKPAEYSDITAASWAKSTLTNSDANGALVSTLGYDATNKLVFPTHENMVGAYMEGFFGNVNNQSYMFMGYLSDNTGLWGQTQGPNNSFANFRLIRRPIINS